MGIPTAVHESNAVPGLAVRRLAHRVDRVWLGFENARLSLHSSARILVTGNPLPVGLRRPQSKAPLPYGCARMILSFGGSLGARELNRAVISLMEAQRGRNDVYHLHATGRGGYEDFMKELQARGLNGERRIKVVPFIENMPQHMAAADLVICRAGAMSISELAAAGKAAILIPSPNVVGNHQYRNAAALKAAGAAVLLEEARAAELPSLACELMANDEARRELSRRIAAFAERDAGRMIYEDLRRLIREKRDGKR
jgi:UDP-N-acetylglucosamine--N-acetylmuramyl-(pentapeptide) pyrophosphoryl-undecaprenol N-acetylglucosamine transferase